MKIRISRATSIGWSKPTFEVFTDYIKLNNLMPIIGDDILDDSHKAYWRIVSRSIYPTSDELVFWVKKKRY